MNALALFACAALPAAPAAETNAPPPAAGMPEAVVESNAVTNAAQEVMTDIVQSVSTNVAPVKIVYPDVSADDFNVEEWAEELSEAAAPGVHIRNGQALVLVKLDAIEGEHQSLTKLRAKFLALDFLRFHFHDLPKDFSASCRVLVSENGDSGEPCIVVMAFRLDELKPPMQ